MAGNPPEHHDVRHSVSAKAVTPVDSAGNFATSKQPVNRLSIHIKDPCHRIYMYATHSMMNSRLYFDNIIRSPDQRQGHLDAGPVIIRIFSGRLEPIVTLDAQGQSGLIETRFRSYPGKVRRLYQQPQLVIIFNSRKGLANVLVEKEKSSSLFLA